MFGVLFHATIFGGPNDGADITFSGTVEMNEEALASRKAMFRIMGHVYRVDDFDKEKKHLKLHFEE